jgi:hypothetical protein
LCPVLGVEAFPDAVEGGGEGVGFGGGEQGADLGHPVAERGDGDGSLLGGGGVPLRGGAGVEPEDGAAGGPLQLSGCLFRRVPEDERLHRGVQRLVGEGAGFGEDGAGVRHRQVSLAEQPPDAGMEGEEVAGGDLLVDGAVWAAQGEGEFGGGGGVAAAGVVGRRSAGGGVHVLVRGPGERGLEAVGPGGDPGAGGEQ